MSLLRKNENVNLPVQTTWDPFREMRELFRWEPLREMAPAFPRLERMEFVPTFEVKETPEGFVFRGDLPGVKAEDLEVQLVGNRLSIAGKREEETKEKNETFYAYERSFGTFTRVFTLPEGIDAEHIKTELKDGVLTLVVPKKAEAKPKKIEIKVAAPMKT